MNDSVFPHIKDSITNFLYDEEGNIPRSQMLTVGSMMLVMGIILGADIYAGHSSHRSHSSHSSHRSHSSGGHSTHSNHGSHSSHSTHATHSNSSHSTHATHSNSSHSTHATHSNSSHSTHATHSNVGKVTHSNSAELSVPETINVPYNIARKEGVLLGTQISVTASGEEKVVNNVDISKIK